MAHRREFGAGIELGNVDHQACQNDADHGRAEHLVAHLVVRPDHPGHDHKADQRQAGGPPQAGVQRRHDLLARFRLDHRAADDGTDDGHRAQQHRVNGRLCRRAGDHQRTKQHGRDQGHHIGFEQVGSHAGAVAHVVAHVVGDHRRIARIIFWNARLHLAHQVGANVGALGEDAATEAGEDRDQGGAEGQADHRLQHFMHIGRRIGSAGSAHHRQHPVETGYAQQAQADHQHAGDGAALERNIERFVHAHRRGLRGTHIGPYRHVHADKAASAGQHGAKKEADGGFHVNRRPDGYQQNNTDDTDGAVLAGQVGRCTLLDGCRDFLHAGVARVLTKNPAARPQPVHNREHAARNREPQTCCHKLPPYVIRIKATKRTRYDRTTYCKTLTLHGQGAAKPVDQCQTRRV